MENNNSILTLNQITVEDLDHYTVLKLLHEVISKANELVGSTNGVYEILTYLLNEGLAEEVVEVLAKWLEDGTLEDIIDEGILQGVGKFVGKDNILQTIRQPHGICDTACNFKNSNVDKRAEICGFSTPSDIATYEDRDIVLNYSELNLLEPIVLIAVSYTADSVTVSELPDWVKLEENDMVDIMIPGTFEKTYDGSQKYSGLVQNVVGKTIYVKGWYKMGNKSEGQIPPIDTYLCVIVNPVTKGWLHNSNLALHKNSLAHNGVICEYGLFNNKGDFNSRLSGVDVVSFSGTNESGFVARCADGGSTGSILHHGFLAWTPGVKNGFKALNTETGFVADVSTCAFKTANDAFYVDSFGQMGSISMRYQIVSTPGATIDSRFYPLTVITAQGEYSLNAPSQLANRIIEIYSVNDDGTVKINSEFNTKFGGVAQIQLKKMSTMRLWSDGSYWYVMTPEALN